MNSNEMSLELAVEFEERKLRESADLRATIEHAARGIMAAIVYNDSDGISAPKIADDLWAATARVREETTDGR